MNALLLLALSATAQIPVVIDVPPGTYVVRITAKADGTATVTQLKVHSLVAGPEVDPIPPTTGDLTEFSKRVQSLTAAVDDEPETLQAFAMLYDAVAKGVTDGSIKVENANKSLALGSNAIVGRTSTGEKWKAWREGVSAELLTRAASGKYSTPEEIAGTLDEVVAGINAHADSSGLFERLDPDKLQKWLEFIVKLIALFQGL
jgi:hypothetical protein